MWCSCMPTHELTKKGPTGLQKAMPLQACYLWTRSIVLSALFMKTVKDDNRRLKVSCIAEKWHSSRASCISVRIAAVFKSDVPKSRNRFWEREQAIHWESGCGRRPCWNRRKGKIARKAKQWIRPKQAAGGAFRKNTCKNSVHFFV